MGAGVSKKHKKHTSFMNGPLSLESYNLLNYNHLRTIIAKELSCVSILRNVVCSKIHQIIFLEIQVSYLFDIKIVQQFGLVQLEITLEFLYVLYAYKHNLTLELKNSIEFRFEAPNIVCLRVTFTIAGFLIAVFCASGECVSL